MLQITNYKPPDDAFFLAARSCKALLFGLVAATTDGGTSSELVVAEAAPVEDPNVMKVKDDPEFSKYFKMLLVGIPNPVVKHKMTMDGLDPSVLDMKPSDPSPNA